MSLLGLGSRPGEVDQLDAAPAHVSAPADRRRLRRALWLAPIVALVGLLYSSSVHIVAGTADGATAVLEGQSIAHGNLALHGWALSLDSFWALDATIYAIAIRVVGLRLELLHLVPALIAVGVIVLAAVLAGDGRRGASRWIAGATVVGLLALPSPDLAYYLLQGPWHIDTALFCLVAFAGLARGRYDWAWILAVCCLAAGLLSDLMIVSFGIVPIVLAAVVAMLRSRKVRAGIVPLAGTAAALALAVLVELVAHLAGTFTLVNRNIPIRKARVEANFGHLIHRFPDLLGVGTIPLPGVSNGTGLAQGLHVAGLLIVLGGVALALVRLALGIVRPRLGTAITRHSWRLDDLLLFAVFGDLVLFIFGSPSGNTQYGKYLTPGVIFAVVLAARMLARTADRLPSRRLRWLMSGVGAVLLVAFAIEFGAGLSVPAPQQEVSPLDAFLVSHKLNAGIGDYLTASLVTVGTGGRVTVRPVEGDVGRHLTWFARQSSTDWYRGESFNFLVYDRASLWRNVDTSTATASFGRPTHVYQVGTYRVLVWTQRVSVPVIAANYGSPLQFFWSLRSAGQLSAD